MRLFGAVAAAAAVAFKLGTVTASAIVPSPNTVITDEYVDLKGLAADPTAQAGRVAYRDDMPDFRVSRDGVNWTSLEVTERKGAANGYADLDGTTKVPTAELGTGVADATTFLRGDRTWSPGPGGGGGSAPSFLSVAKWLTD